LFLSAFDGFKIVLLTDMIGLLGLTVAILNVVLQSVAVGLLKCRQAGLLVGGMKCRGIKCPGLTVAGQSVAGRNLWRTLTYRSSRPWR